MAVSINTTAGEVLEVIYNDKNPSLNYALKVKLLDNTAATDSTSPGAVTASPLNSNILRIPLVGEIVLLVKAPTSYASGLGRSTEWYYTDIVNLQKEIHHNSIPTATKFTVTNNSNSAGGYNQAAAGNSNQQSDPAADNNFTELDTVRPLQPYVGDLLIQGRYGNSIRMTTTPKTSLFSRTAKWSAGSPGAPITIIRNTAQTPTISAAVGSNRINNYVTEDFKNEDNVIVMSSGQKIEFEQASGVLAAIKSKNITSWKDDNWGESPQTLISSGRIIFNSWQKEIIAFAKKGIGLSSETDIAIDAKNSISLNSKKIELGDNSTEPLILGTQWKLWTTNLINAIGAITPISPVGPCLPLIATPQWASISSLVAQLDTLLSQVAFTKKLVNVVPGKSFTRKPSDRRLKDNLKLLGQSPSGINIYEFNFISDPSKRYQGVVADELIGTPFEVAVTKDDNGYLVVDYSIIDVKFIPSFDLTEDELRNYQKISAEALVRSEDKLLTIQERQSAKEAWSLYSEKIKTKKDSSINILLESPVSSESLESMAIANKTYILYKNPVIERLSNDSLTNGVNAAMIAMNDVGVVEGSSKKINIMLRNVKFRENMNWAAAAVSYWWKEANIADLKFGTCKEWYEWAQKNMRLSTTPVIGSIALFRYGGYTEADNIGIVVGIDNEQNVTVVEGDTYARYQNSGTGGVFMKVVNTVSIIGYIIP